MAWGIVKTWITGLLAGYKVSAAEIGTAHSFAMPFMIFNRLFTEVVEDAKISTAWDTISKIQLYVTSKKNWASYPLKSGETAANLWINAITHISW